MKICVYGAGSIGGHLAARLARGGADVSVVARGSHLAAIERDGLVVQAPDGEFRPRLAATTDPARLGAQDTVIVTVKAPSLPSVASAIGPLLGPETTVVFAANGIPWWYFKKHGGRFDGRSIAALDPGGSIECAIGCERTLGGVIYGPSSVVAPGVVRAVTRETRLIIGELDGALSERSGRIAAVLREGGMAADVSPRIRDEIWSKLIQNLAAASLALLTGTTVQEIYCEPACLAAGRDILAEGLAIAKAFGCQPPFDTEKAIALMQRLAHKSSALQDLEKGRPVEIDALFTVPLELARMVSVPTPVLDLLTALIKLRVRSTGFYAGPEPAETPRGLATQESS